MTVEAATRWDAEARAELRRQWDAGTSEDEIAAHFRLSRGTIVRQAMRFGCAPRRAAKVTPVVVIHSGRRPSHDREEHDGALPAGHPITWGAITAGTILEGAAYG